MRGVELSQLSNEVYAVAGYALVAELSSHEVSKLSMVVCTFEISDDFQPTDSPFTQDRSHDLARRVIPAVTWLTVYRWLQITRRASPVLPESKTGEGLSGPTLHP